MTQFIGKTFWPLSFEKSPAIYTKDMWLFETALRRGFDMGYPNLHGINFQEQEKFYCRTMVMDYDYFINPLPDADDRIGLNILQCLN